MSLDLQSMTPEECRAQCEAETKRPGRFEGARRYAPWFEAFVLDGGADFSFYTSQETEIAVFRVSTDDCVYFPELRSERFVAFWIDETGFCHARPFATEADLDAWQAENEAPPE